LDYKFNNRLENKIKVNKVVPFTGEKGKEKGIKRAI